MKNCIFFALLCFGLLPAQAQKIIEKHIPFSARGFVSMNFQISDSIRIITWKKDEVYIKSSIDVNDNQDNDAYKMVFDESGSTIAGETAEIRARSISGFIDLAIPPQRKAELKMHTISGTMYTNIELPTSHKIKQVGGRSVTAELNGEGGKSIDLKTISGNIFFRKEG